MEFANRPIQLACPAAKAVPFPCLSFGRARRADHLWPVLNLRAARRNCPQSQNHLGRETMPGIHSQKVVLVEGKAEEFVPKVESAGGMHGFAIMVPPGEGGDRLLDMMWRITMAYAGIPSLLYSRANVRKMVEAVMSHQSRSVDSAKSRPARASRVKGRRVPD